MEKYIIEWLFNYLDTTYDEAKMKELKGNLITYLEELADQTEVTEIDNRTVKLFATFLRA